MRSQLKYALTAVLLFLFATPASGLMCVTDQGMTPSQVLEAGIRSGNQSYDMAFVAVVRSETTSGNQQTAEVDLIGVYGHGSAPPTTTMTFGGVGVAGGTIDRFDVGTAYFIPVVATGPAGEPNYTSGCDPISVVVDPDTTAIDLAVIAEGAGIEFSLPQQTAGEGGGGGLATLFVVVALVGLFLWTGRLRRTSRSRLNATGSDPRPPQLPRL